MPADDLSLPDPDRSAALVRRIHAGERDAFADLYHEYRDRLLFAIRCRMGATLRAHLQSEDVLQSVMREALDDLAGFTPRGAHALARYLHTCALNKLRAKGRHWQAERRRDERPLTDSMVGAGGPPGLTYRDPERWDRIERGLSLLPPDMREVILLRQLEGASNAEAAAALGRTEEASSKLFTRAMARLTTIVRGTTS